LKTGSVDEKTRRNKFGCGLGVNRESRFGLGENSPKSLDFLIGKFVQEVTEKNRKPYPGRTLYQIVAGLKRHLETKHRTDVNMLDKSNS